MSYDFVTLLGDDFNGNAAASRAEIARAELALSVSLPEDFKHFLLATSGGEGMIGGNYVMLWQCGELAEFNEGYQVKQYAPGLVIFGSDGGGEAYAFDTRVSPYAVVMVPYVGMSLEDAKTVAPSFVDFLRLLGT